MSGELERFDEWADGINVKEMIEKKDSRIAELAMTLYPGAEYVLANHISYSWLRRGRTHTPDECLRLALQTIGRVLWWLDPPTSSRTGRRSSEPFQP